MKNRISNQLWVALVFAILLFTHCGGSKSTTSAEQSQKSHSKSNPPSWVKNRPVDPEFFIGIAVASKTTFPTSFALVAQNNALNEMAGQIDVQVKSNSMLFSFEDKGTFTDEYKEFIQVKANQQITNYEQVDSWENESEYWVYFRLSKAQYRQDKQAKIDQAINQSTALVGLAERQESNGDLNVAMKTYFEALEPIKTYLGEPLQVMYQGEDIYLGNYIFSKMSALSYIFTVKPFTPVISSIWGGSIAQSDLKFIVEDDSARPISGVTLQFVYSEGIIRPREDVTNSMGEASSEIRKISSTKSLQEVQGFVDFSALLGDQKKDEIYELILKRLHQPMASLSISVNSPVMFVNSIEKSFDETNGTKLQTAFISQASILGFRTTDQAKLADLIVNIDVNTTKAGISYDLHNVLLNGTVTITNQNNQILYQENFKNIKGVSNSFTNASVVAYEKAIDFVREKVVPRFYRKYLS
jgi:hypothetical protein